MCDTDGISCQFGSGANRGFCNGLCMRNKFCAIQVGKSSPLSGRLPDVCPDDEKLEIERTQQYRGSAPFLESAFLEVRSFAVPQECM